MQKIKLIFTFSILMVSYIVQANNYAAVPPHDTKKYTPELPLDEGDGINYNNTFYLFTNKFGNASYIDITPFVPDYENLDTHGYPYLKQLKTHELFNENIPGEIYKYRLGTWGQSMVLVAQLSQTLDKGLAKISLLNEVSQGVIDFDANFPEMQPIVVDLPGHSKASHWDWISKPVEYKGHLYFLVEGSASGDNKLYLIRTKEDKVCPNPTWEFFDFLRDENGFVISRGSDDIYSMFVANINTENGLDKQMVVARSHSSKVSIFHFEDNKNNNLANSDRSNWPHITHSSPLETNLTGAIMIAQCGIDGAAHDPKGNYIQCILSEGTWLVAVPYDIDKKTFGPITNLHNQDGHMVCLTGITTIDNKTNRQHLYAFTAAYNNQLDIERYSSNIYKLRERSADISKYPKSILDNPSLRELSTLIGIVEGPPPTALQDPEDFAQLAVWGTSPSSLTLSTESETRVSSSDTYTGSAGVKFVGGMPGIFSLSGGIAHEANLKYATTNTKNTSLIETFEGQADAKVATLFYSVPQLILYEYNMLSPDGTFDIFKGNSIHSILNTRGRSIYKELVSLSEEPFNVEDPTSVISWSKRDVKFDNGGDADTYTLIDLAFDKAYIDETTRKGEQSNSKEREVLKETTVTAEFAALSDLFFGAEGSMGLKFSQTISSVSTITEGITLSYAGLHSSWEDMHPIADHFKCNMYVLTKGNAIAETHYYPKLRLKGYQNEKETPWIIAYRITDVLPTMTTGVEENKDNQAKFFASKGQINGEGLNPGEQYHLFNPNGQCVKTGFTTSNDFSIAVPNGVYILKIQNKSIKMVVL